MKKLNNKTKKIVLTIHDGKKGIAIGIQKQDFFSLEYMTIMIRQLIYEFGQELIKLPNKKK